VLFAGVLGTSDGYSRSTPACFFDLLPFPPILLIELDTELENDGEVGLTVREFDVTGAVRLLRRVLAPAEDAEFTTRLAGTFALRTREPAPGRTEGVDFFDSSELGRSNRDGATGRLIDKPLAALRATGFSGEPIFTFAGSVARLYALTTDPTDLR